MRLSVAKGQEEATSLRLSADRDTRVWRACPSSEDNAVSTNTVRARAYRIRPLLNINGSVSAYHQHPRQPRCPPSFRGLSHESYLLSPLLGTLPCSCGCNERDPPPSTKKMLKRHEVYGSRKNAEDKELAHGSFSKQDF